MFKSSMMTLSGSPFLVSEMMFQDSRCSEMASTSKDTTTFSPAERRVLQLSATPQTPRLTRASFPVASMPAHCSSTHMDPVSPSSTGMLINTAVIPSLGMGGLYCVSNPNYKVGDLIGLNRRRMQQ
ncbi:hypothetical protein BT67DRAFT_229381 [Trichocladium antarcticum]|uniref:Uncharacterized protein n=1 Tax=Trichocladium antarcticum TaxID=1450529 RepID=A0AAN6ZFW1_9PEZI|nr:hypothetical protein BT67DRAFT_229381 [Trichocladium antarcticum]